MRTPPNTEQLSKRHIAFLFFLLSLHLLSSRLIDFHLFRRKMAEDLAKFKLQYQQVEAALLGDPSNDELLKLKSDLTEMITLQVLL